MVTAIHPATSGNSGSLATSSSTLGSGGFCSPRVALPIASSNLAHRGPAPSLGLARGARVPGPPQLGRTGPVVGREDGGASVGRATADQRAAPPTLPVCLCARAQGARRDPWGLAVHQSRGRDTERRGTLERRKTRVQPVTAVSGGNPAGSRCPGALEPRLRRIWHVHTDYRRHNAEIRLFFARSRPE